VLFYSLPFFLSAGIIGGSTAKNKKNISASFASLPAQPVQLNVCPMKCLPKGNLTGMKSLLHLFHRGEAYFSGAKPPVALVLSNIHPAQVALDIDVCALV